MRRLLILLAFVAACTTLEKPKGRSGIAVTVRNGGRMEAQSPRFLVLKEGHASGPMANDAGLLAYFSRIAKDSGRDVKVADDMLDWAMRDQNQRYMVVIQNLGVDKKAKKFCHKLQVLYFLPGDLQEAAVDPTFRQELEGCDTRGTDDSELVQAALRVALRHLGREGTFLDERSSSS